jgi:hypothetical protein
LTWFSNQTIGLTIEMYDSLVGDVESYFLPLVTITAPSGVDFHLRNNEHGIFRFDEILYVQCSSYLVEHFEQGGISINVQEK